MVPPECMVLEPEILKLEMKVVEQRTAEETRPMRTHRGAACTASTQVSSDTRDCAREGRRPGLEVGKGCFTVLCVSF